MVDKMQLGVSPNKLVFLSYYHSVDALYHGNRRDQPEYIFLGFYSFDIFKDFEQQIVLTFFKLF
jgi:hypothetical protein